MCFDCLPNEVITQREEQNAHTFPSTIWMVENETKHNEELEKHAEEYKNERIDS